jgi:hypothetical protein
MNDGPPHAARFFFSWPMPADVHRIDLMDLQAHDAAGCEAVP